ncbi:MAG TPA: HEAT repeat domain-containing protein, partial [Anaerolineales bacterium]|nr:HEAT repeat domain-containing protein [Anaerolineales bacterium]
MSAAKTPLGRVLDELAQGATLSPRALQEFSDLDPASLQSVMQAWPAIPVKQKHVLLDALHRLANENTLVSFDDLARALLTDADGQVRQLAIRLLQENDDPKLAASFVKTLAADDDPETRREAASALGHFVELGELERIPAALLRKVEDALLEKVNGSDQTSVRRRALESLGYSSRPEVATLIQSAAQRENPDWQASALVAMGLSSDERWEEQVLARLQEDNVDVRLAAVEAAGELRLSTARQLLFEVLEEEDEDQVSSAAIWSLSQIGGEDVRLYIQ